MNKYVQLISAGTNYAKRMNRLSRHIFGDVVQETSAPALNVMNRLSQKPFYKEDRIVNYYPRHPEIDKLMRKLRSYGLYRDEHMDFKEETRRLRALKGKTKPKKGEGKQRLRKQE